MELIFIILIIVALFISLLCRSLVHRLLHYYDDTKLRLELLFKTSIDDNWWNPDISWKNKYKIKWTIKTIFGFIKFPIPTQVSDAFHFFNTIELGGYAYSISMPTAIFLTSKIDLSLLCLFALTFIAVGLLFMIAFFNFGYNSLWHKK